jgi:hypothetical protein
MNYIFEGIKIMAKSESGKRFLRGTAVEAAGAVGYQLTAAGANHKGHNSRFVPASLANQLARIIDISVAVEAERGVNKFKDVLQPQPAGKIS